MKYNVSRIETAFFNYDNDGSEGSNESWQKRREEWAAFKKYLNDDAMHEDDDEATEPESTKQRADGTWTWEPAISL